MELVIDVNNVVFTIGERRGKIGRLMSIFDQVDELGNVYAISSSSLRYRIDNNRLYNTLIKSKRIVVSPPVIDTDQYILELAKLTDGYIISNDQFREYEIAYSEVIGRRLPFLIVEEEPNKYLAVIPWKSKFTEVVT